MDRRDFLKMIGVASGTTAFLGCNLDRDTEKLIPYLVPPEDGILPGQQTFVATSCTECPAGCGVSARVVEGHPVKVDGLEGHPVNDGALCVRGQASINRLYLPERIRQPLVRGEGGDLAPANWDDALAKVAGVLGGTRRDEFLSGRTTGSLSALAGEFCAALVVERLPELEVFSHAAIRRANREYFGRAEVPWYRIDRADFLLTVGADVIGTFQNPNANVAAIAAARASEGGFAWYHAEAHSTLSGFQAMDRLILRPGSEAHLLAFLLRAYQSRRIMSDRRLADQIDAVPEISLEDAVSATGVDREILQAMVEGFAAAERPLVIAGETATAGDGGLEVARLAALIQAASGMVGETVDFTRWPDYSRVGSMRDVEDLVGRLEGGRVGVLFVFGTDPLGRLPESKRMAAAFGKAELVVGVGDVLNDTMSRCDVVLPLSHTLESWGDVEPRAGVVGVIQPAFEPLFDTRSDGDILLSLMAAAGRTKPAASYQEYVVARWRRDYGNAAAQRLIDRGVVETPLSGSNPTFAGGDAVRWRFYNRGLSGPVLAVTPSHRWYDGRSAEIPLLHEVPDPLTSISWGGWVSASPETTEALGVADRDEVELSVAGWTARLPVREQPGMARDVWAVQCGVVQVPTGWSRETGELGAYLPGLTVRPTSNKLKVAILAGALGEQGRGVVPGHEVYHFAPKGEEGHITHEEGSFYKEPKYIDYRWAMAIDMDRCVGCAACVAACYIENNVPMTGEEEHLKGREMSWIRIEPYYSKDGHADFIPSMCQHCDYAPCEPVCPVFAAYTNEQGLAVQVYNRCVGTRYCSNNCPYKQRRFNWFAWNKRPEPMDLMVNPDVSLRGKGIMEKCSFCYQRIRRARDTAKDENRKIQEGDVTTACAQACPGNAIVFGNLLDENSEVTKWSLSERSTRVLEDLGTGPAVYYLTSRSKSHQHHNASEGNHDGA
jgi:anaerobic selenocysteine-containing dehydrogenase/Fe-S-cluster-containing dehydrogenase component